MTKRVLYLSGGGDEMQSKFIDADFEKRIDGKKVMYIPVALERDVLEYEAAYDWITKTFLSFEYSVDVPEIHMHLDLQRIASELSSYDALYIGEGNTFSLLDFFTKII